MIRTIFFVWLLLLTTAVQAKNYETIEWIDLLPPEDLEALSNPPSHLASIKDEEAAIDDFAQSVGQAIADSISPFDMASTPYFQALVSTRVVEEVNGKDIRIPGYIVPLEFNDDMKVTAFFLVPFFGACIHYPPPPPNQIIHAKYAKGIAVGSLFDPHWIEGKITTNLLENEMAISTYALDAKDITLYQSKQSQ